jgi:hypothetical protein
VIGQRFEIADGFALCVFHLSVAHRVARLPHAAQRSGAGNPHGDGPSFMPGFGVSTLLRHPPPTSARVSISPPKVLLG